MDVRAYYGKVRRVEQELVSPHVVVVSMETQDGGRDGIMTEVRREAAARLIVDSKARLATAEETHEFYHQVQQAVEKRDINDMQQRLHLVLNDEQTAALRKQGKKREQ